MTSYTSPKLKPLSQQQLQSYKADSNSSVNVRKDGSLLEGSSINSGSSGCRFKLGRRRRPAGVGTRQRGNRSGSRTGQIIVQNQPVQASRESHKGSKRNWSPLSSIHPILTFNPFNPFKKIFQRCYEALRTNQTGWPYHHLLYHDSNVDFEIYFALLRQWLLDSIS